MKKKIPIFEFEHGSVFVLLLLTSRKFYVLECRRDSLDQNTALIYFLTLASTSSNYFYDSKLHTVRNNFIQL